jgi:hypothetical protein
MSRIRMVNTKPSECRAAESEAARTHATNLAVPEPIMRGNDRINPHETTRLIVIEKRGFERYFGKATPVRSAAAPWVE